MNTLKEHRQIWNQKKIIRKIYYQWYKKIVKNLIPGKTLEIGSGSGNFKEYKPDVISSDIDRQPWLDMHFDAHKIPFKNKKISNIVMIDVFHHLKDPFKFLNEAYRVLKKNGKIIMVEPYPSPFSLIIYRLFHQEPFNFHLNSKNNPNQAIPFLIFSKHKNKFNNFFKNKLKIVKFEKTDFFLYPLSGGFGHRQLIPNIF